MPMQTDDALRAELGALMARGLVTHWEKRAFTSEQVNTVVAHLQELAPDDYEQKLIVAGFTDSPYEIEEMEQACDT